MSGGPAERREGESPRPDSAPERKGDGRDVPRDTRTRWQCDLCGNPMRESHCKLICDQCGYTRDCSDP